MKRGIKNILLSLAGFSAAPILTACYGMPDNYYDEPEMFNDIKGFVVDTELNPIKDIEVYVDGQTCRTNENGSFHLDGEFWGYTTLTATDVDGEANGGEFGTVEVPVSEENHAIISVVMSRK